MNNSNLAIIVNSCIEKMMNASEEDIIKMRKVYDENTKESNESTQEVIL